MTNEEKVQIFEAFTSWMNPKKISNELERTDDEIGWIDEYWVCEIGDLKVRELDVYKAMDKVTKLAQEESNRYFERCKNEL